MPIALAGMELAHAIANGVFGSPEGSGELFAAEGSGGGLLVPVVALASALVLVGLATHVAGAWKGLGRRREGALPFALAPLFAFVALEAAEGVAHHGSLPWGELAHPAFVAGLGLQLPFAAIGYLLAWLLLRVSDAVRRLVAAHGQRRWARGAKLVVRQPAGDLPRPAPECSARRGRAPPLVIGLG